MSDKRSKVGQKPASIETNNSVQFREMGDNIIPAQLDMLTKYINLIYNNQNLIMAKFDHVEKMMSASEKQNIELSQRVAILDEKIEEIAERLDNFCDLLEFEENGKCDNSKNNPKNNGDYNDNDGNDNDGNDGNDSNDKGDNGGNESSDYTDIDEEPEKKESKTKLKGKKNKYNKNNDSITIKVEDEFSSADPLDVILELVKMGKMKGKMEGTETGVEAVDVDSDDEYDKDAPVFETDNEEQKIENFVDFEDQIHNIKDLINIGNKFEEKIQKKKSAMMSKKKNKRKKISSENEEYYELDGKKYSINLEIVNNLIKPLKKLSNIIGMEKVKEDIFEMIIYFLQGFEKNNKNMLHSVIEGPPGVGKTKLGKTLSQIYCALGIITSNKFKYVKATDLIGDHVGATKHMTQEAIDEADGGVLFIDEAYALSSNDNKDPYGKECIDTLNFNLSENKKKLIVIIAGYPDYLDKYFFSFNPGLQRRFPFKFRIDSYTPSEMRDIFIDKLKRFKWKFSKTMTMDKITEFFVQNKDDFTNFGGDMENLFKKCQFAHAKRIIGKDPHMKKKITYDDMCMGFESFKKNKRENENKPKYPHMYS